MKLVKVAALCLLGMGLMAWKCGGEKKTEEVAKPAAAGETAPADMNLNQPADVTVPAGVEPGQPPATGGETGGLDPAMGGTPDEVPVGTEGAEPGLDYTGDQDMPPPAAGAPDAPAGVK